MANLQTASTYTSSPALPTSSVRHFVRPLLAVVGIAAILSFAWQFFRKSEWDEMFRRGTVSNVAFSPDRQIVASSSLGEGVRLWNASDKSVLARLGDSGFATQMVFSPDGRFFAWSYSSYAQFYSSNNNRAVLSPVKAKGPIWSMAIAPNNQTIAVGSTAVELWNIVSGDLAHSVVESYEEEGSTPDVAALVSSIAFSPDGKLLAAGSSRGNIKVWELLTADVARPFTFTATQVLSSSTGTDAVTLLAFSQGGRSLAAGTNNGTVSLVSVPEGKVEALRSLPGSVNALAFSPDSSRLAVAFTDINARGTSESGMVHKPDKIEVVPLKGNGESWTSDTGPEVAADIRFSADGKKITVTYWDSSERSYNLP